MLLFSQGHQALQREDTVSPSHLFYQPPHTETNKNHNSVFYSHNSLPIQQRYIFTELMLSSSQPLSSEQVLRTEFTQMPPGYQVHFGLCSGQGFISKSATQLYTLDETSGLDVFCKLHSFTVGLCSHRAPHKMGLAGDKLKGHCAKPKLPGLTFMA